MAQTRPVNPPRSSVVPTHSESPASLAEIIGGLAGDIQDLVRGEIALARSELDQKFHRILVAFIWLLGGALLGFAGLVVLLQALAALLAIVLPVWLSALVIGVVVVGMGAVFANSGLGMLSLKELSPDRTVANIQKDAHIVKEHA
jgi:putative superfamily III holin-X